MRFPSFFILGFIATSWLWSSATAHGQLTGISIESVLTHDASIDPSLDGLHHLPHLCGPHVEYGLCFCRFRRCIKPLVLGCTGNIYQSFGVNFNYAIEVNPLFFGTFPTGNTTRGLPLVLRMPTAA